MENMWKYSSIDDLLEGGKADNKTVDIPKKEMEKGLKVESEHSDNPEIQEEIIEDHEVESVQDLSGEPNYYEYLDNMEEQMKQDRKSSFVEQLPSHNKNFNKNIPVTKPQKILTPDKFPKEHPSKKHQENKKSLDNTFDDMLEEAKGRNLDITGSTH
jgi:hypothetical protein